MFKISSFSDVFFTSYSQLKSWTLISETFLILRPQSTFWVQKSNFVKNHLYFMFDSLFTLIYVKLNLKRKRKTMKIKNLYFFAARGRFFPVCGIAQL